MGNGATECGWRHAPEARGGFWGFWKKSVGWVEFCLGRRQLAFACSPKPGQWPCGGCRTRWGGGRCKSQNRKNVYLSPYVEEPLNSKVIKCFVPELRSHKCFSCFEIPMFYVYMIWTFYVRFNISVSWVCYTWNNLIVCKQMSFELVKMLPINYSFTNLICICMNRF